MTQRPTRPRDESEQLDEEIQWVALSLVDAGTFWHVAGFLKNREPKHVVKRMFEEWIKYGSPTVVLGTWSWTRAASFLVISTWRVTNTAPRPLQRQAMLRGGTDWQKGTAASWGPSSERCLYQFKVTGKLHVSMGPGSLLSGQELGDDAKRAERGASGFRQELALHLAVDRGRR